MVIVTQLLSVSVAGIATGMGVSQSLTAGIALGQIGEFAFIIGAIGVSSSTLGPAFQAILVSVAVLSTFSTSLLLARRETIVSAVERALPARLSRRLVGYEAWWERVRRPSATPHHALSRMVLDLVVALVLILSWRAWKDEIGLALTRTFRVGDELSDTLSGLALGLSLLPLLFPLVLGSRALAQALSVRLFTKRQPRARAFFSAGFVLLFVGGLGVPGALFLVRVVDSLYVWPVFLTALVVVFWLLWRSVEASDTDVRSGGLVMLRTILGQVFSDDHPEARQTLAGLRKLHPVTLREGDFAQGKSLAELDFRLMTGATVVALKAGGDAAGVPTGHEELLGRYFPIAWFQPRRSFS